MEFNSVTPVVLGMLRLRPRSGYDIKAFVDRSTRFFWAASYGQIYPELKRLESAGLIAGESEPNGARPRTVYRLTPAGERALHDWLVSPSLTYELRDEAFLKLFFADALTDEEALELLRAMRRRHEEVVERLRAIEPYAERRGGCPYVVLQGGLALHGFTAEWCEEMEQRLLEERKRRKERKRDVQPAR